MQHEPHNLWYPKHRDERIVTIHLTFPGSLCSWGSVAVARYSWNLKKTSKKFRFKFWTSNIYLHNVIQVLIRGAWLIIISKLTSIFPPSRAASSQPDFITSKRNKLPGLSRLPPIYFARKSVEISSVKKLRDQIST